MQEGLHADHGRGIYLIRELIDEVLFERDGQESRMWKCGDRFFPIPRFAKSSSSAFSKMVSFPIKFFRCL
jgi:hypothetical protein